MNEQNGNDRGPGGDQRRRMRGAGGYFLFRTPFAALFLIPLYLLVFRNDRIGEISRFLSALVILAVMFGTVVLMYYLMGYIAEYFEVAPAMKLAQIIRG